MKNLDEIKQPSDIKDLKINELEFLCANIREYMIECCSNNPGHVGSSLGVVELTVALHYIYNTPKDKLVWDVGHQAYSHKILTGRKKDFINNRKLNGISGFPKMSESEYDSFGVGHSSTSISAALGIDTANKIKKEDSKVIAIIGDGSLTGGLAFEGLNNAGAQKSDILVILNDNQISIDKNVGALHNYLVKISTSKIYNKFKVKIWNILGAGKIRKLIQKFIFSTKLAFFKSGSLFESLGFRYFGIIDGNNLTDLINTLEAIKDIKGPKLLHIKTTKGKGYSPAEKNQITWHAPGVFDKNTGERIIHNNHERYQDVFGKTLVELASTNDKIVGITAAMPSGTSLNLLFEKYPDRAFDVGIAESHAITFAAGMASQGLLPFCAIYSSFLQRAYDNIIHDVALQKLKVVFCIDRAGIVGEDGATHHGVFDISYLRLIPNMCVSAPSDEIELRNLLYSATCPEYNLPITIRYPRSKTNGLIQNSNFEFIEMGTARFLKNLDFSKKIKIGFISFGTIANEVSKAINLLEEKLDKQISICHLDMRFIKPFDKESLDIVFNNCQYVFSVEEGTIIGGLFGLLSEYKSKENISTPIIGIGIDDCFIEQGTISQLHNLCKIDSNGIEEQAYSLLKNIKIDLQ